MTVVSFFFAQFLPGATGGDLARLFYAAKDYKGRRSEILTVSLFDRATACFRCWSCRCYSPRRSPG